MVQTSELPVAHAAQHDPLRAYEAHFGALPSWFDEISEAVARSLALYSLRRGAPLSPADDFYY